MDPWTAYFGVVVRERNHRVGRFHCLGLNEIPERAQDGGIGKPIPPVIALEVKRSPEVTAPSRGGARGIDSPG